MKDVEKEKFLNVFMTLCEMWEKEPSENLIDLWWTIFKRYSLADFQKGIAKAITTLKNYGRLPMPLDIIDMMTEEQVSIEDRALVVASQILEHLRKGHSSLPENFDPVAKQLMATRWNYYDWSRTVLTSEIKWWVKEFCEAYRACSNVSKMIENNKVPPILDGPIKGIAQDINKTINWEGKANGQTKTRSPSRAGS